MGNSHRSLEPAEVPKRGLHALLTLGQSHNRRYLRAWGPGPELVAAFEVSANTVNGAA